MVGDRVGGTGAYTVHRVTWPSQGGTMTGLADIPVGPGPFPVAIVNHGYIPAAQYRTGQDSTKYADAFAAAGNNPCTTVPSPVDNRAVPGRSGSMRSP